jgi:hypothetical protein
MPEATTTQPAAPAPTPEADTAREAEIKSVMRTDFAEYKAKGLDTELAGIQARRAEGTPEPADDKPTFTAADLDQIAPGDEGEDDDGEGGAPAEVKAQPAEVQPIGPPEGVDEATWRAEHGIPDEPEGYQPPDLEGSVRWDTAALGPIFEVAHEHSIPQPALEALMESYAVVMADRQLQQRAADKERRKAVVSQLSKDEVGAFEAAATTWSPDVRRMLKDARLSNGQRLMDQLPVLQALAGLRSTSGAAGAVSDELLLAEADRVLRQDVGQYVRDGHDERARAAHARKAARAVETAEGPRPGDAERAAQIRAAMKADFEAYKRAGLDVELSAILRRQEAAEARART